MTIFRANHNKNYSVINNTICTDNRLSYKAKGIWMYAFSRPDDWVFYLKDIVNQSKDGEDAVRSGLKELEECGYLLRSQDKDENGRYKRAEWDFFETPQDVKKCLPKGDFQVPEKQVPVNPSLLSTDVLPSIERKQQQQAVKPAVAFPKMEFKDIINVNLLYIDIPDAEKRWISEYYDDDSIKNAVGWATHPDTKIKTSLSQAIKWACQNKPKIPSLPEDNREIAKKLLKQVKIPSHLKDLWRMEILTSYVEISCGNKCDVLQYTEKPFKERLEDLIRKSGCRLS